MKTKSGIFTLLAVIAVSISACKKDAVTPATVTLTDSPKVSTSSASLSQTTTPDVSVKGYLRLQLEQDNGGTDEAIISFKPGSKTSYVRNEDSPYFTGFGSVSLSTLSSDNVALAINAVPLIKETLKISLKVNAKADGIYKINMTDLKSVPEKFDIWLMDSYKKDSLDIRHNLIYAFNLKQSDTLSYGSHRFSLVVRQK